MDSLMPSHLPGLQRAGLSYHTPHSSCAACSNRNWSALLQSDSSRKQHLCFHFLISRLHWQRTGEILQDNIKIITLDIIYTHIYNLNIKLVIHMFFILNSSGNSFKRIRYTFNKILWIYNQKDVHISCLGYLKALIAFQKVCIVGQS